MKKSILGVSLITTSCLYGLLAAVVILITLMAGGEVLTAIYGSIIVLIIQFLISPALTDLSMRLFYRVKFDQDVPEFAKKYIFAKNIARVNQPVVGDTFGNYTSNNRKRLAQMETRRQYKGIEDIKQFENIGTDWQNDDWCM